MDDLAVGIGIALVIEGALMALLPEAMKQRMSVLLSQESSRLRVGGVVAAAIGVGVVWLVRGGSP
ncbi:MAG: DUF2065 domain-containing protein [Alphaproteobacteria bacterium]|nr:DUF2065 domain-containing protein [Alphaproteobacteria bacterium]